MVGSFIFGGDTGKTPEQVARERRVAEALLARGMRGGSRNAWEGLGGLANAIAGRYKSGKVAESERRGRASGREAYGAALEAMLGGVQAPAGAAPPQPGSTMFNPDPAEAIPAGGGGSLMDALIRAESGGDPSAVSSAGAVGLTQIMPDTARDPGFGVQNIFDTARGMGMDVAAEDDATLQALLRDPEVNRAFGESYLGAMQDRYGATPEALAAYNAGPGAVDQYGGVPPFQETQNYVSGFDPAVIQQAIDAAPGMVEQDVAPAPVAGVPGGVQQGAAEMAQNVGGGDLSPIVEALQNPWLEDWQRQTLTQVLMQRMQGPETMTPYQRAQLGLAERRLAAQMGGEGGFAPMQINVPGEEPARIGTIPQGYALHGAGTPDDPYRYEAIVGGPEDTSGAEAAQAEQTARAGNIVIEDIGRLKAKIENAPWYSPTTGAAGSALRMVPGTNAFDAQALQQTIAANIGFDRLQQMREASPTGGALGAVSERELDTLQAVLGNISLSQSEEQLLENLDRLEGLYTGILEKAAAYPNADEFGFTAPLSRPDDVPQRVWDAATEEEKRMLAQ